MIKELVINKKPSIIENWVKLIIETYPPETSKFLRSQKDRFSNPVGYAITSCAENIFDEIINENNIERIKNSLNDIIKIRAVQNFLPSNAVEFVIFLKKVIREELKEFYEGKTLQEFLQLESRIDRVALIAFDLYMEAKEKIFQIRVNEVKSHFVYRNNKEVLE